MIRLSAKDLARLGHSARNAAAPKRSARRRTAPPAQDPGAAAGGRMARRLYPGPEVTIECSVCPQPKERARTFVEDRALLAAYVSSGGDVRRFMAAVKGQGIMRTVTPEATRRFEEAVALIAGRAMSEAGLAALDCPVAMRVEFRIPGDPELWPTGQTDGDLDNHEKAVKDGLNKVAYVDDRQIVMKISRKICAAVPGITVSVRPALPWEGDPGVFWTPAADQK